MGTLKNIGKGALKKGKSIGKASWKYANNTAEFTGKGIFNYGSRIVDEASNNTLRFAASAATAGAATYALTDFAGEPNAKGNGLKAMGLATAASAIPGATAVGATIGAAGIAAAGTGIGLTAALGRAAIKTPTVGTPVKQISDLKFSKLGVGMLVGSAAIEGGIKAAHKFEQGRMGQHDGMMRKPTQTLPQVERTPSYENNGGATGDLVFAMYNNR